jgi:hypothetical protein
VASHSRDQNNWPASATKLRTGDVVRVRSREDILATLDENGRLDGQPFMPEMLQFVGKEFRVYKSAHKTCDTITKQGLSRMVDGAVHLEDTRCDGSAHDGCQARCLLFWRYDWLETLDGTPLRTRPPARPAGVVVDEATLHADTKAGTEPDGRQLYRCSATEVLNATQPLSAFNPRQYIADVRTGNASIRKLLKVFTQVLINKYQTLSHKLPKRFRIAHGRPYPFVIGADDPERKGPAGLDLQVGERVRVRSRAEVLATLDANQKNRGLWFDAEMMPYCGQEGVVKDRIERIVDETTGRLLKLRDCIVVDGMVCQGQYHRLCPRSDYAYWRESWLERVDGP